MAGSVQQSVHSAHQRWYASLGGQRGIYTPQFVVAGQERMLGSRRQQVFAAIAVHEGKPVQAEINLSMSLPRCLVDFRAQSVGQSGALQLHLALTQERAHTSVDTGENVGESLEHTRVIVDFDTWDLDADADLRGSWLCEAPAQSAELSVTAFVQQPNTGAILAALHERP